MFSEAGFLWFRRGITLVLIVVCNLVLLGALWGSGLDLDGVLTNAAFYDPQAGYCLRVAWVEVSGVAGRRMTAGKAGRRMTAKEHTHGAFSPKAGIQVNPSFSPKAGIQAVVVV